MIVNNVVYIEDITEEERNVCYLYSQLILYANRVGYRKTYTQELYKIFYDLQYGSCIRVEDIELLKLFEMNFNDIASECYEYDDEVDEKLLGLISKIDKEFER